MARTADGRPQYTKGVTVQVLKKDQNGQPTESIERDTDSQLWHVSASGEPKSIREDEVSSLVTESSNRNDDRH